MTLYEEIGHFTNWLSVCEASAQSNGVTHMHGGWAMGVWDDRANEMAAPL